MLLLAVHHYLQGSVEADVAHILRLFDGGHAVDDISATPREKTREEIIAEAEAAAFADS